MNQDTFGKAVEELITAHKAVAAAREHFIRAELLLTDGREAPLDHESDKRLALYADTVTYKGGDGAFFRVEPMILQLAKLTSKP